jgi:Ca2+/Na+ antiporter
MILNFIRILLIVLLLFVIIVDFNLPIIISTATNQLFIAIIILFLIITVDEIIGFITGLIFLIIYFKYYQKKISHNTYQNQPSNDQSSLSSAPFSSFMNYFTTTEGDIKPKSYSRQPEIPDHFVEELKNDNSALLPYISNEILKSAQNNIYNEDNYNTEIKQSDNFYGIQGLNSDNTHFAAFDNNYTIYNNL